MMKLRYLVGMAGLAAAATGLTAPAAMAGTTPAKASPPAKIVMHTYGQAPAAGCTGVIKAHANHNHEGTTFWYRKNGCVGTIVTITYANVAGVCANPQIHIYANGKLALSGRLENASGAPVFVCVKTQISWPVHKIFTNPVGVWGKAVVDGGGVLGPAGRTVNR